MRKKLTKEIVNGRIIDRGITLVGEYIDANTKTEFQCNCGYKWHATPNNIMAGRGCSVCSTKIAAGQRRLSKEIVNQQIIDREITLIGEYMNSRTKAEFQCKCGNKWHALPANIIFGSGCPVCSKKIFAGKIRLSKEIVNQQIIDRGIELVSNYINANTKAEFQCKCGNIWESKPSHIMGGRGCPVCARHGYNPGKPGWLYILIFNGYIKYGITNNLEQRLGQHRLNGEYTLAFSKEYRDGNQALLWERNIKIIFGGRFVSKEICPDGYTETLSLDKLEALLDTVK